MTLQIKGLEHLQSKVKLSPRQGRAPVNGTGICIKLSEIDFQLRDKFATLLRTLHLMYATKHRQFCANFSANSAAHVSCGCLALFLKGFIGRTPKGAYSSRERSRHLLETAFSEPFLRTLSENPSQNPFYCKTYSRPPSQNPSENPFPRALSRTLSEPFLERCVAVRPLRRAPNFIGVFLRGGNGRGGIPHPGERYNVCPRWCRDTRTVTRVRHHLLC